MRIDAVDDAIAEADPHFVYFNATTTGIDHIYHQMRIDLIEVAIYDDDTAGSGSAGSARAWPMPSRNAARPAETSVSLGEVGGSGSCAEATDVHARISPAMALLRSMAREYTAITVASRLASAGAPPAPLVVDQGRHLGGSACRGAWHGRC